MLVHVLSCICIYLFAQYGENNSVHRIARWLEIKLHKMKIARRRELHHVEFTHTVETTRLLSMIADDREISGIRNSC